VSASTPTPPNMPKSKTRQQQPAGPASPPPSPPFETAGSSAQRISRLLVHLLFLGFTALFLPRSSSFFTVLPPPPSSLDRPEPEWLQPLSASPSLTLFWLCFGAGVGMLAWCGSVRAWVFFERVPQAKLDEALMKHWVARRRDVSHNNEYPL
jgi:phosphatidylinositol glycan class F